MSRLDHQQEEEGRRAKKRREDELLNEIDEYMYAPREDDDED